MQLNVSENLCLGEGHLVSSEVSCYISWRREYLSRRSGKEDRTLTEKNEEALI